MVVVNEYECGMTGGLSQASSPEYSENVIAMRLRGQPFGNHHAAVIDNFAQKHEADKVCLLVNNWQNGRVEGSPFLGEEVGRMISSAYENDIDTAYEVEVVVVHDEPVQEEVIELCSKEPAFVTRDKKHVWYYRGARPLINGLGMFKLRTDLVGKVFDIDYEERTDDDAFFDEYPEPVETSSTRIREMIRNEEEWRHYVPGSVADLIDNEFHESRKKIHELEETDRKHLEVVKSMLMS